MKKILAAIAAVTVLGGGVTAAVLLSNQSKEPMATASPSVSSYTIEYMPNEKWGGSTQVRWGPELFAQPSDIFNYDLALAAAALSAAAYGNGTGNYIVNAYETLGFSKMAISLYGYPDNEELNNPSKLDAFDDSSLAFSIASKSLKGEELVVITLRGTKQNPIDAASHGYLDIDAVKDWGTNLHFTPVDFLGVKAHAGFNDFFNDVLRGWNDHMERHPSLEDKKIKILITGHSLGGAVANMLGAFFNAPENLWANEEGIYVYTLAAPKTYEGKSPKTTSCNNIFNIINKKDQVPTLLNGKWFGCEKYFSEGDKVGWDGHPQQLYIAKIKEMRDTDTAIVEMEASYAESVRVAEAARVASSRAAEQSRVESSRAAEEESRRQAEEESRRQEEEAERRKLETLESAGIIVMTGTTGSFTISTIDPETGFSNQVRRFVLPSGGGPLEYANLDIQEGHMNPSKYMFDENYRRYAITHNKTPNEAGWITEDGLFYNVSEKVLSGLGDFSVRRGQRSIGFGVDGWFYYVQEDGSYYRDYKRVPINNVTPSAVEDLPDYMVARHLQQTNNKSRAMAPKAATDFLNNNQCIVDQNDRIAICDALPYTEEESKFSLYWSKTPNLVEVIPNPQGRTSWGGIASPDSKKIAFISYASGRNDLFTVVATGGEPTKISTGFSFSNNRSSGSGTFLIDWR